MLAKSKVAHLSHRALLLIQLILEKKNQTGLVLYILCIFKPPNGQLVEVVVLCIELCILPIMLHKIKKSTGRQKLN